MARPVIHLKAGDDKSVRVAVQNPDGSDRDLTGETLTFRAATSLAASAATITKTDGDGISIVDLEGGLVDLVFVPDDTLNAPSFLLWELQVTDSAGLVVTLDWSEDASDPWTYGVLKVERALLATG